MIVWIIFANYCHLLLASTVHDIYPGGTVGIGGVVKNAAAGDVIQIHSGVYTGASNCDIQVAMESLQIVGIGEVIIDCQHQSRCISVLGVNVTISGIQFWNGRAPNTPSQTSPTLHRDALSSKKRSNLPVRRRTSKRKRGMLLLASIQVNLYMTQSGQLVSRIPRKQKRKVRKLRNNGAIPSSFGGCIAVFDGSSVILSGIQASGGQALMGGGIGISGSTIVLKDSNIDGNGIVTSSDESLYGGGVFVCCSNTVISNSSITNNFLNTSGESYFIFGAGIATQYCSNITMVGPVLVANNVLVATPAVSVNGMCMYGAGIYIEAAAYTQVVGPLVTSNNSIILAPAIASGTVYIIGCGINFYNISKIFMIGAVTVANNSAAYSPALSAATANIYGGGIHIYSTMNATIIGPLVLAGNSLVYKPVDSKVSVNSLNGAGIFFSGVKNVLMKTPILIANNTLISNGVGNFYGAGVYAESCSDMSILGPIDVSYNAILTSWKFLESLDVASGNYYYYTAPRSNNSAATCSNTVTITNTMGTLNDGSFEQPYSNSLHCMWLISPSSSLQFSYVFNLTFKEFDTEIAFDFLYLYDGPTSLSPLIGQYSGNFDEYICTNGPCPLISSSIISSTASLLVVFTSDESNQGDGFTFDWKLVNVVRSSGLVGEILSNFNQYPMIAVGAGIVWVSSHVWAKDVLISHNSISGNGFSAGGGAYLDSCTDNAYFENVMFRQNEVRGFHAAGGGIAVTKNSVVQLSSCDLQLNFAYTSNNICIYTFEQGVICPGAFGGNLLASSAAKLLMTNSILHQGTCTCDTGVLCSAVGGSVAVLHQNTMVTITDCTCKNSTTTSSHDVLNAGGCLYVYNGNVEIANANITSNVVTGVSFGGAIYCAGFSHLNVVTSFLSTNTAKQGGAIAISDTSVVSLHNCLLAENIGMSVGGALFVKGDSTLLALNSTFFNNFATRASTIYTFNDNNNADYKISDSFNFVPIGSSCVMLGRPEFKQTTWNCSQPGTVFTQDSTDEFFALTCVACDAGTYAIAAASTLFADRKCQSCPFGGRCLGSSAISNGLYAVVDYWGQQDENGTVAFHLCPIGYCCPLNKDCGFDHCQGNRVGTLCGRCPEGYGMRFFAQGCKSDDSCKNDIVWFGFVLVVCAIIGVLVLLATTGFRSTGMLSVLLYFYQVLPLVKSTSWKYTIPDIISIIQSVFSFSESPAGDSGGVCLMKSMTTSQKLGSNMLLQALIFLCLLSIFILHWVVSRVFWKRLPSPKGSHYFATGIRFCTIAYTTLVLVPLQMIQCVYIGDDYVWWRDGTVLCFEMWQKAGFVAIAILSPLPLVVILLFWKRWKHVHQYESMLYQQTYKVLSNGFKQKRRWWLGISLYRRLMMVVAYSSILDRNWRAMATAGLCVVFLVMNFIMQPFKSPTTQNWEMGSLFILCLLAVSTAPQLSMMQFGTSQPIFEESTLEWIQFVLSMLPIAGYALICLQRFWGRLNGVDKYDVTSRDVTSRIVVLQECDVCKLNRDDFNISSACKIHQYC